MTTYTFPSINPTTSTLELVANTKTFRSPLTNAVQTVSRKGSLWRMRMTFKNLSGDDRSLMQSFLAKLNGQEHRFYVYDHAFTKRGVSTGTINVKGAGQTGSSLICYNGTSSTPNFLREGDYIAFNNELHMVTADVTTDGVGEMTIQIAPPIRKPTINADIIDIDAPVLGVFMLASKAAWTNSINKYSDFTIEAVEDVLA